jgi:predicted dienelactone hydrolase
MTKILFLLFSILISSISFAQFQVGHTTITFNDPTRTGGFGSGGGVGRQIQTEIYYPAATNGENVNLATGTFPVIVFGHGFAMAWSAYENIWTRFAEEGYIIAFPRTESGLFPAPNHGNFGQDLSLVVDKIVELNTTASSLFENKINGNAGIMGHSMGGGAAFLGSANNTSIKTVVGLAPAETNPLASEAAINVTVPTLILSGSKDGVTPAADHHTLIYNGLATTCKYFLNLIGGAHCYFANTNTNCDFGELTSSPGITLTRAEQQAIMFDYILPWFAYHLKLDCNAWNQFTNPQASDSRITALSTCSNQTPLAPVITMGNNVLTSSISNNIQWYKDGIPVTGETNVNISLSYGFGTYKVIYTFSTTCSLTSNNFIYDISTGIDILENAVSIYPNPTNSTFKIEISNGLPFEVNSFTVDGKLIQTNIATNSIDVESSRWNSGIYFIEIKQGNSKITKRMSKH